jgi:hypothetical protein
MEIKLIHFDAARLPQPSQYQIVNNKHWQDGNQKVVPGPWICSKDKRIFEYDGKKNTRCPKNLGIILCEHAFSPVELHTRKCFSNAFQVGQPAVYARAVIKIRLTKFLG